MNHHPYHQNLPCWLWYYINSDNNWFHIILYVHKKIIYTHIYLFPYDVQVQMIISKYVLVHIWYGNDILIYLQYVSHFIQYICHISNEGPAVCKRGNLVPWSAPVARVHPQTADHRKITF